MHLLLERSAESGLLSTAVDVGTVDGMRRQILPTAVLALAALVACSGRAEETPPVVVDDPEGVLTVVAPPALRDALEAIDRAWTEEGYAPLLVDFDGPPPSTADHGQPARPDAGQVAAVSDVVLTDDRRTVETADPELWTVVGVVATTSLLGVVPADQESDAFTPSGSVAVCGSHCGELAEQFLGAGSDELTALPVPEDVADGRRQVRAADFAELPPGSGQVAVLAVVDREADLGIAYEADLWAVRGDDAWPDDRDVVTVRPANAPPVEITALVSSGRDAERAAAFVDWLRDGPGRDVLEAHFFDTP